MFISNEAISLEGDLIQLAPLKGKSKIFALKAGGKLQSEDGVILHDDLIGKGWGSRVESHLGASFILLQPALDDLLRNVKRNTQTLYPKDIGYILLSMGIGPDQVIVEAGTGSGAMAIALAHAVGKNGHIYSYERRPEMLEIAKENLVNLGLEERVTLKLRDIEDGFDEKNIRAVFFDVPNPEDYLEQARALLQAGGFFGCILPTTNQVSNLIKMLKISHFAFIEVSEILHRYYKAVARRFRPADRMTAHTGYLIFARKVSKKAFDDEKG